MSRFSVTSEIAVEATWVRGVENKRNTSLVQSSAHFHRLQFKSTVVLQDWQVPLGRRFRALKLWFVLRTYGGEGLRGYLRHHISLAADFARRIESDPRFKLAAPPRFSLVCFTLAVSVAPKFCTLVDPARHFKIILPSKRHSGACISWMLPY